jgi:23S rRNA (guanosine2251-2'-O)-methyltransferase
MSSDLFVKNPHSILPALQNRPKDVLEVIFPRTRSEGVWDEIESLAMKNKVRTRELSGRDVSPNDRKGPPPKAGQNIVGRDSSHGATIRAKTPESVESLFRNVDGNTRGVWLALDSLQDPQNLGAIFRSAAFFGIKGIILTSERSAPMSATVYDISSGGVEAVPYVPIINLQRAFEKAKEAGLWILGTSEHAKESIFKIKNDRPWLLVMGNEENGIRRLTEEACDMMCTIPAKGDVVTSLNVSVATGILLGQLS